MRWVVVTHRGKGVRVIRETAGAHALLCALTQPRTCHPPHQGLPYAMASQGWVLGLCVLALATGASAYSAFLLAEVRNSTAPCLIELRLTEQRAHWLTDWLAPAFKAAAAQKEPRAH